LRVCEPYRGWASRLSVTMQQADIGGDKPFVDYAGDMLIEIDPTTDAADRDGIARHPARVYHASG
jgi:transposase